MQFEKINPFDRAFGPAITLPYNPLEEIYASQLLKKNTIEDMPGIPDVYNPLAIGKRFPYPTC